MNYAKFRAAKLLKLERPSKSTNPRHLSFPFTKGQPGVQQTVAARMDNIERVNTAKPKDMGKTGEVTAGGPGMKPGPGYVPPPEYSQ